MSQLTKPLTVLVVQHDDDCGPALLGDWLAEAGIVLDVRRAHAGEALPEPTGGEAYDGVLVLGGPMGAQDDDEAPWLPAVRELIRDTADRGVATLGICLGHQLIAVALGGDVQVDPAGQQLGLVEVGWRDEAADDELFGSLVVHDSSVGGARRGVHWNNDVVSTPPSGATILARAPGGEVQAARFAPRVWGVQWHPEADLSVVRPWARSDEGSHRARGVDQKGLLSDIDEASAELETSWRPLAEAFARVLGRRPGVSTGTSAGEQEPPGAHR